jgi:DNA-directed RNA polymerase subunit beta'
VLNRALKKKEISKLINTFRKCGCARPVFADQLMQSGPPGDPRHF